MGLTWDGLQDYNDKITKSEGKDACDWLISLELGKLGSSSSTERKYEVGRAGWEDMKREETAALR